VAVAVVVTYGGVVTRGEVACAEFSKLISGGEGHVAVHQPFDY